MYMIALWKMRRAKYEPDQRWAMSKMSQTKDGGKCYFSMRQNLKKEESAVLQQERMYWIRILKFTPRNWYYLELISTDAGFSAELSVICDQPKTLLVICDQPQN